RFVQDFIIEVAHDNAIPWWQSFSAIPFPRPWAEPVMIATRSTVIFCTSTKNSTGRYLRRQWIEHTESRSPTVGNRDLAAQRAVTCAVGLRQMRRPIRL